MAGAGNINVYDPNRRQYLGQLRQPNGAPIAIKGLWDLEFGDGTPHGGKTNQLYFDAGPNKPGDSTGGLFGVIHAAGDHGHKHDPHDYTSIASTSILSSPTMPSSIMPTSTMLASTTSSPNGVLEQQMDAIFQELDAALLSLESNRTAMNPQLSGFFAMFISNLNALEATALHRLDALETTP